MEAFTLSNLPLMARKSVETFKPEHWRVLTESTREGAASNSDWAGMEPYWGRCPSLSDLAATERRDPLTLSKISETV